MDASSAIILYKAGLHEVVTKMYNVVMPRSVYMEITGSSYPGAEEYQVLLADSKISVMENETSSTETFERTNLNTLDKGEHDTIRLYYAKQGDFVITDDGAAAKYCIRESIPFINALLIPAIMSFAKLKSATFCQKSMKRIITIGRYSSEVITFAQNCKKADLSAFIPQKRAS